MIFQKSRSNLYILCATILYIVSVITYAYFSFSDEKNRIYRFVNDQLENAARSIPLLLPDDYHHQSMNASDQFKKDSQYIAFKLSQYTAKNNIHLAYTLMMKNNRIIYTSSSTTKEDFALGKNSHSYFAPYRNTTLDIYQLFNQKQKVFHHYRNSQGNFLQVFVPLYSNDGMFYFSVAEMSIDYQEALLNRAFYKTLISTILFLLVTCITYFISVYKIKKITHQLVQNEERLSLGLKISRLNWFDHNIVTGKFSVSEDYYQLLGYKSEKFYSILNEWLSCIHKDDEQSVLSHYQTCLETGGPCTVDYRIQTKAGKWLWFRSIAKVVEHDKTQSPTRIIGSHLEITRDKNIEQQLLLTADEAKKANQAKSKFLSSMSHELRTPLNAILGFSQLLDNDLKTPLTSEQKEKIGYVMTAGNHLLSLINDVLSLSAIEADQANFSIETVNLTDAINESIILVDSLAKKNRIKINVLTKESNLCVSADYVRLKQILLNLLSNAIKYNRPEGTVNIGWFLTHNNTIRMSISDTGIGIPVKNKDKVFDAFNRLGRENSGIEGTGVGLMVTKSLIESMQGKIDFESVENKGSTFWFELPVTESSPAIPNSTNLTTIANHNGRQANKQTKHSILYVEDNPINQQLISAFFEEHQGSTLHLAD